MTRWREALMVPCLIVLCMGMGAALGGGVYEGIVLTPLWSANPPGSFTLIQPGSGVPLQTFWIPAHGVISIAVVASFFLCWQRRDVRDSVAVGFAAYVAMRAWSFAYFIPEMLEFQSVTPDTPHSADLVERVESWITLTWWRMPLDVIALAAFLFALVRAGREMKVSVGVRSPNC